MASLSCPISECHQTQSWHFLQGHTPTQILTETVPGRPQTCYHTAPQSGASAAATFPNCAPSPRLMYRASGQARPGQARHAWLCVIQPRTGWHKLNLHPHHSAPQLPHANLDHHLSLDRWGLGRGGRLAASVLATAICLVSPRKARGTAASVCQLAVLRTVVPGNSVPCHRTLTHCHCAVQCDWSGPFSQRSQVRGRSGPPTAPPVRSSHDIPTSTTQTLKSCQLADRLDMLCLQLS